MADEKQEQTPAEPKPTTGKSAGDVWRAEAEIIEVPLNPRQE